MIMNGIFRRLWKDVVVALRYCPDISLERLRKKLTADLTLEMLVTIWPRMSSHLLSKNMKMKIWRTIILPILSCWCETWSLTLREGHRLRAFRNRVIRNIFGPRRNEITEGWRKLHSEDLHGLYWFPNNIWLIKSRIMRWVGHVACVGKRRGAHMVLVGKPEGRSLLGKPRHR